MQLTSKMFQYTFDVFSIWHDLMQRRKVSIGREDQLIKYRSGGWHLLHERICTTDTNSDIQQLLVISYPVILRVTFDILQSKPMNGGAINVECAAASVASERERERDYPLRGETEPFSSISPSGRYHCCKTSLAPLPILQLPAIQPALSG